LSDIVLELYLRLSDDSAKGLRGTHVVGWLASRFCIQEGAGGQGGSPQSQFHLPVLGGFVLSDFEMGSFRSHGVAWDASRIHKQSAAVVQMGSF